MFGAIAFVHGNSEALEKDGHRRVDIGVRSTDVELFLAEHARQGRHRGAANSDEIDLHEIVTAGSSNSNVEGVPTLSLARTPKGTMTFGFEVWPVGNPNRTGMPKSTRRSRSTSSS